MTVGGMSIKGAAPAEPVPSAVPIASEDVAGAAAAAAVPEAVPVPKPKAQATVTFIDAQPGANVRVGKVTFQEKTRES